jgi:DNA transformation protein
MGTLAPLGDFASRAMFGGWGIFNEGRMFALIAGNTLYFKVDDSNRADYEAAGSERFAPMPYYEVPADVLEDESALRGWLDAALKVAHSQPPPKKRRKRKA